MSRKVVLLGPLPPPYGGVSVYLSALREHLRGEGVRTWALYGDKGERDAQTVYVNHRRFELLPVLLREGRGARVLDATHFHFEYPHKILLPLWLACKRALGFEWHKNVLDGTLPARHREFTRAQHRLFRRAVANVDRFVVVSEELRRWLRDEVGARQEITVVPCLLPIPRRHLEGALPAALEARLAGYFGSARRVCAVGVFIPSYGFAQVAAAVESVRRETGEDVGLALLDGAFARDEQYRTGVLKGREWITVLENVPNPDVYRIMRRSDAFVRGVSHEGYGISRVEATWCGLPVVATRAGETRGMLTYEFGDVDELTAQLRRALYDETAHNVGDRAEVFRVEAEANLRALRQVLKLT